MLIRDILNFWQKIGKSRWGVDKIKKITTKLRRSIYFTVCTQKSHYLLYSSN